MRLFIRGFPKGTSSAELQSLVQRIAAVQEVYIPGPTETGIHRGFAIVRLVDNEDSTLVGKCVKKLDNCIWKGGKIQVEAAEIEFYKDRLKDEKTNEIKEAIEKEKHEKQNIPNANVDKSFELKTFDPKVEGSKVLNLRRIRGGQLIPIQASDDPLNNSKNGVLKCGRKTIYDENSMPVFRLPSVNEEVGSAAISDSTGLKKIPERNNIVGMSETRKQLVPGKRLGFGTLLIDAEKYPENYAEPVKPYIMHAALPGAY